MSDDQNASERNLKVQLRGTSFGGLYARVLGAMSLRRLGKLIGYSGQDAKGRSARADLLESGEIVGNSRGAPARGEDNALFACQLLVAALRKDRPLISDPVQVNDDADCECLHGSERLRIQVVQAVVDQATWKALASKGRVETPREVSALVAQLCAAVDKKSKALAPTSKAALVLALDATRFPALALSAVVDSFMREKGRWCSTQGFREVWLVGPNQDFVHRLDARPV